jgi:hypothetical protein
VPMNPPIPSLPASLPGSRPAVLAIEREFDALPDTVADP